MWQLSDWPSHTYDTHSELSHRQREWWRRSCTGCILRAVKLLGNALPMPGEDRLRRDDASDFRKRLLAELLTDLGERLTLAVA